MNIKLKPIFWVLIIIAVLILAYWAYDSLSENYEAPEVTTTTQKQPSTYQNDTTKYYEQAPDATVYNSKGEKVALSSLFTKPVVINFWARWCGPCKSEMPDFESVYKEKGNDVTFIMVNMTDGFRETQNRAQDFIKNNKITIPVYFDLDSDAANKYAVYSIPTTVFLDAKGNIINVHTGLITKEQLIENIDAITKQ